MAESTSRFRFTLFSYLLLWLLGVGFGAMSLFAFIRDTQKSDTLTTFMIVTLGCCYLCVVGHQFHVYRSIHKLEDGELVLSNSRYIGSWPEVIIRCFIFTVLLLLGGKVESVIIWIYDPGWKPQEIYAAGLVAFFALLLIWDVFGFVIDTDRSESTRAAGPPDGGGRTGLLGKLLVVGGFFKRLPKRVKKAWNSDKYSRRWFIPSDVIGLGISITVFLIIKRAVPLETIEWTSFFLFFYMIIIGVRFFGGDNRGDDGGPPAEAGAIP